MKNQSIKKILILIVTIIFRGPMGPMGPMGWGSMIVESGLFFVESGLFLYEYHKTKKYEASGPV